MVTFFYNLFILVLGFAMKLASLWNPKAKQWVNGRKDSFEKLNNELKNLSNDNSDTLWMHCASLGEFEQGRPLLEKIKAKSPKTKIILSFYSPSGYEIRKNYKGADIVCYLPLDTAHNAKNFIKQISPTLVLWVKYEFWMHYLLELKRKKIPVLLISGLLQNENAFYKLYRKKLLGCFTHFFVQTAYSAKKLAAIGFNENVNISGDTRFDRVIEIAQDSKPIPAVDSFCLGYKVIVAGSTWLEDEEELTHFVRVNPDMRFIIAPHEVDVENIKDVQKQFPHSTLFSKLQSFEAKSTPVPHPQINAQNGSVTTPINTLIIDNIGMLSRLYQYADIAYVGGGFGDSGLHNILEAAVYGKPVFFGPIFQKHFEAVEMEDAGGAISIENALELESALNKILGDELLLKKTGDAAKAYVYAKAGATLQILDYIYKNRLLTN